MGAPSRGGQLSRPAKREQITGAARAMFLERGYAGTSMDAVTAAAGVSKQTVYSYFPSKAVLFAHILEDEVAQLRLRVPGGATIGSVEDLRRVLLALARELTRRLMTTDMVRLLRLLLGEAYLVPEVRDAIREAMPRQLLAIVGAVLGAAVSGGVVTVSRPDLSARMFVGPVVSFVVIDGILGADPPQPPDDETLAFVVDAFLATLTPREARP